MANAFKPTRPSVSISATTTSARAALNRDNVSGQVRIYNAGTATAFVTFGDSSVTALATDMPVPSGMVEVVSVEAGSGLHAAAITASGTATVYFTMGSGV
jgi:hypothetical protein